MIKILEDKYNTENTKVVNFNVLKEDSNGKLLKITLEKTSKIYKISLSDGRVYIGQTNNMKARRIAHKTRFKDAFEKMEVIIENPNIMDEIESIRKYRDELGYLNVANIDAGSPVPEPDTTTIVQWFDQSATQKAIMAYKELISEQKAGVKITQGQVAEKFGIHRNDVSLVSKLLKISSPIVIDTLFDGGKITLSNGKQTDNLRAIIKYFEAINDEATGNAFKQPKDVTDAEWEMINEYVDNLAENHATPVLEALASTLFYTVKNMKRSKV